MKAAPGGAAAAETLLPGEGDWLRYRGSGPSTHWPASEPNTGREELSSGRFKSSPYCRERVGFQFAPVLQSHDCIRRHTGPSC